MADYSDPAELSDVQKFLGAIVGPFQVLEDTLQQMAVGIWDPDVAIGAQLTRLGAIVGRGRGGITDDDIYLRYVKSQIVANRSSGTVNTYIKIARLVLNDVDAPITITEFGGATLALVIKDRIVSVAVAQVLVDLITLAEMGGTRVIVKWSQALPADTFAFEGDTGEGFGSVYDADAGGVLASSADRLG